MNAKHVLLSSVILALAVGCSRQDRGEAMKLLSSIKPEPKADKPTQVMVSVVTNGMSEVEFRKICGEPKGEATKEGKVMLFYDDFQVSLQNGAVYNIPEQLSRKYTAKDKPSALEKIKDGKISIPAPKELKAAFAKRKAYPLLNSEGKPVEHSELICTGKITVVQFFIKEDDTSAQIDTEMETLLKTYDSVEVRTVYTGKWDSELSKRYHISSVPDIRVLDSYGNLISQPITRIELVDGHIDLTRVKEAIDKVL